MILPHLNLVRLATALLVAAVSGFATNIALAAPPAVTSDDVIADPAAAWRGFLAQADIETAYAAYDALAEVGYSIDAVDPELCRSHVDTLRKAVALAPVSIALQRASMMCAQAMGDDVAADRALAALTAVSKQALAQASDAFMPDPIRVLHPLDAYALVYTGGLAYRYEYFAMSPDRRFLPLVIAAWDAEDEAERHLTFDYLDAAYTIGRSNPLYGFPVQRQATLDAFVKGMTESKDVTALDFRAVMTAGRLSDGKAKVDALRPVAELGGINSLEAWIYLCATAPYPQCADGLVDALLPAAEQQHAWPMTMLAFAYGTGLGLKQDIEAAEKLLDAADRRWLHRSASVAYAKLWIATQKQPMPDMLTTRLARAKADGNVNVDYFAILESLKRDKPALNEADLAYLSRPRNNGTGKGYSIIAAYYKELGKTEDAMQWTRRAAMAGDPASQATYGFQLLDNGDDKDIGEARRMLGDAAHGGDERGARGVAWSSASEARWTDAEGWLAAAADVGYIDAMLQLAEIYEEKHPGVIGTPADAIRTYRSLAEKDDVAEARRRLARMAIEGNGMPKDPQQARKWLLQDAEKGDHKSELMLGMAYLRGQLGAIEEAEGRRWVQAAMQANEDGSFTEYGAWLFYVKHTPQTRREAIDIWHQGDSKGFVSASNNLAWALCTAPEGDVYDTKRGIEVATRLAPKVTRSPAALDTVAACHAAVDDFARAIEVQLSAIEQLSAATPAETVKALKDRLALYRSGKRYVEKIDK